MTDGSSQVPATCPFCGAQVAAFAGFCLACGRAINSAPQPTDAGKDHTSSAPATDASQPAASAQPAAYVQPWGNPPAAGYGQPPSHGQPWAGPQNQGYGQPPSYGQQWGAPQAPGFDQPPGYSPTPGYSQTPGYGWQPTFQTGYGYAPAQTQRNNTPIALGLLAAGLVLILAAGALVVVAGGSRSAGAAATPAASRQAAGPPLPLGDIVAPSLTTPSDIPTSGRTLGSSSAPVTVEVWADYQCPPCLDFNTDVMPKLIDTYVRSGKVKVVVRDYVVIDTNMGGTESADAANAASCAADQGKFWVFQDWLFANQGQEASGAYSAARLLEMGRRAGLDMTSFQSCVEGDSHKSDVDAESAAAESAGVYATPTVAVNGTLLDYADYATVATAIDAALATR